MEKQPSNLRERVIQAAEDLLAGTGSVGPLEVLEQMGWLADAHVKRWRSGHPYYRHLEPHFQSTPEKREQVFEFFQEWALARGLKPIEASYSRTGPQGAERLQVTAQGDELRETFFRSHYTAADLPTRKEKEVKKRLSKAPDLVVFQTVRREGKCSQCQAELHRGSFIVMEAGSPLCSTCAGLAHLVFLPSGDAALTRRARKYSPLSAVVVRFSRTRGRYERQGLLVTPEALAKAQEELDGESAE